jgi:hypothetical protein
MSTIPLSQRLKNSPPPFSPEMIRRLDEARAKRNTCAIPYFFHPELDYDWTTKEGSDLLEKTYHVHFDHVAEECKIRIIMTKKVYEWTYDEAVMCLKFIRDFYVFQNPNCYADPEKFWDLSHDSPCMLSFARYQEKMREYYSHTNCGIKP